jgi:hypothetical protein
MAAIVDLPKAYPEVVHVSAELCEKAVDEDPILKVAMRIVAVHLHSSTATLGFEGLRPRARDDPAGFGISECILELRSKVATFPDAINWSNIIVRPAFGNGEVASIEQSLRSYGNSPLHSRNAGLKEVVSRALEVLRRTS